MLHTAWEILNDSAAYLLLGFLFAALLRAVVNRVRLFRHLEARSARSVWLATLIGIPLPLCSCSVLPTALALRRQGASSGATLSFLISTPETSTTSILLTYSLLGPVMAIARPVAAAVTAITAGLLGHAIDRETEPVEEAAPSCCCSSTTATAPVPDAPPTVPSTPVDDAPFGARVAEGMRFSFVTLFDDIVWWVFIGILAAAAIQTWAPPSITSALFEHFWPSVGLMILIGVPLYVCAEASTPIAASLIAAGLSPGAALVFLLVGPATNVGSLGLLKRVLGNRLVSVYVAAIVVVSTIAGFAFHVLLGNLSTSVVGATGAHEHGRILAGWAELAGAIAFLLLAVASAWRKRAHIPGVRVLFRTAEVGHS